MRIDLIVSRATALKYFLSTGHQVIHNLPARARRFGDNFLIFVLLREKMRTYPQFEKLGHSPFM